MTSTVGVPHDLVTVTAAPAHAAPLRAVDSLEIRPDGDVLALTVRIKVDGDEPNLRGHFPGLAVYPGIFVIETLEQAMRIAVEQAHGERTELRTVRSVRFLAPLLDGDEMTLEVQAVRKDGGWDVTAKGTGTSGTTTAKIRAGFDAGEATGA